MANRIDITALPPQQLLQFRKDLHTETEHFYASLSALTVATQKYQQNVGNLSALKPKQQILVPLSSSLYVPGTVKDEGEDGKFLVDVGTGYFVEKTRVQAEVFYEGKLKQLNEDRAKLEGIIAEKEGVLQRVDAVLRQKMEEQEKTQESAQKQAQTA